MQSGKDNFDHGHLLFRVQPHGNAAPVIFHGNTAVDMQRDIDLCAITRKRLIGRVINDLLQNMQRVFSACIHARALAHGLKPLQNPDGCFVVMRCCSQICPKNQVDEKTVFCLTSAEPVVRPQLTL